MSIVTPADFIGEQNIPNTDETPTANKVQWFIDEYEPKLLEHLFGSVLYADYLAGVIEDPIDVKWTLLQAQCKRAIVCYVYYYFMNDNITYNSGVGNVKAKTENAASAQSWDKMVKAWNTMVKQNVKVREFISNGEYETNFTELPLYVWELPFVNECRPSIFMYKNSLDL